MSSMRLDKYVFINTRTFDNMNRKCEYDQLNCPAKLLLLVYYVHNKIGILMLAGA